MGNRANAVAAAVSRDGTVSFRSLCGSCQVEVALRAFFPLAGLAT
jgi:hypothetical protein